MKRKIFFTIFMALILCLTLAVCASAATYYVDKDGQIVDSNSDNLAYKYDLADSASQLLYMFVYDANETKLIIPDSPSFTNRLQIGTWNSAFKVYHVDDTEMKTDLAKQITEIEFHENVYLDGSDPTGALAGYSSLQKLHFYGTIGVNNQKFGFFDGCSSLNELHFYAENTSFTGGIIRELSEGGAYNRPVSIIFHESATGTIETGSYSLPYYSNLADWKYIINPNITPSNPADPRLGTKWGQVEQTTGWELIMAVSSLSDYSDEQLEALKTSHGFAGRYATVDEAVTEVATVMSYCQLGYDTHNNGTSITLGANGLLGEMTKNVGCDKCLSGESTTLDPVFTSLGYSVSETGDLMQGFAVNEASLKEYKNVNNSVVFGLVVGIKEYLTGSQLINTDGTANTDIGKVYSIDFTSKGYQIFEMKVTGLAEKEEYSSLNIYCCGYYVVNNNVYYMSNDVAGQDASGMCTTFAAELEKAKLNDAQ